MDPGKRSPGEQEVDAALTDDLGRVGQPCRCQEACCEDVRAQATEDTICGACGHTVEVDYGAWTSDTRPGAEDRVVSGSRAFNAAMDTLACDGSDLCEIPGCPNHDDAPPLRAVPDEVDPRSEDG
jgi:hypothetical protein